jgi:hypothetical protein
MGLDFTGLGSVADLAKSVVERVFPAKLSEAEKQQVQLQIQAMIEARESSVLETQKAVMVAELQQDDTLTKRVRPAILYSGLIFIFLVHVLLPCIIWVAAIFGKTFTGLPELALPNQFWGVWGGCAGLYIIGRSAEKRGTQNNAVGSLVKAITGGK